MTENKRTIGISAILILVLFLVFGFFYQKQQKQNQQPISATSFKLNTMVKVTIYDSQDQELLNQVMEVCDKYENLFSRTKTSSEIYQLNHGTLPQKDGAFLLSPETAELVQEGLRFSQLSNGAFDLSIEPISSLWDFTSEEKVIPDQEELRKALPLVDYKNIELKDNLLTWKHPGMGLDLGAIAKGYIADRMKDFLVSKGVKSAIINLGGNVLCIGESPEGRPFQVGIQKPFSERGESLLSLEITDQSVVSSGIYERYFEKDGVLYHHILNPKTGYPYENDLLSVSIISDRSVDGDGLSTTCFSLGLEKGMELIDSLEDVEAIFITKDETVHYSKDFEQKIKVTSLSLP